MESMLYSKVGGVLENFFRECDLYPSNSELEDGIDVIFQGR